jgi:hypothetical protein
MLDCSLFDITTNAHCCIRFLLQISIAEALDLPYCHHLLHTPNCQLHIKTTKSIQSTFNMALITFLASTGTERVVYAGQCLKGPESFVPVLGQFRPPRLSAQHDAPLCLPATSYRCFSQWSTVAKIIPSSAYTRLYLHFW